MEDPELTSLQTVFETLRLASCQDPSVLKPAEEKLKEWEIVPGYYTILMKIILKHDIDLNVRWLAILCLKNGVDRYWRRNITNGINDAEKDGLRKSLMCNIREPVLQIATQMAVIVAKIARLDYPREWPQLMPGLVGALKQDDDEVVQHRVMLLLYHVIKSLSSKRLAGDRRLFHELCANIYTFLYQQWVALTDAANTQISYRDDKCMQTLEKASLLLKSLHKLTIHGFVKIHDSPDANAFLHSIFGYTKTMLEQRKTIKEIQGLTEKLEKFIMKMTKIQAAVLSDHPFSYISFLQPTLELTYYYIFVPGNEEFLFEQFLILCLNRLKTIVQTLEYKQGQQRDTSADKFIDAQANELEALTAQAAQIKKQFFNETVLTVICRKLITHYFLLSQQDLALWDSDPETFYMNESAENWKYVLRPCAETLFLALFFEYKPALSGQLVQLVECTHAPVPAHALSAILAKDAVYNAVGLAAFELYDQINFDDWFMSTLSAELRESSTNYRVIRRRVALLLGQWSGVKFARELRPALYVAMLSLLRADEDKVVRLTAANTVKVAVDDFDFDSAQFAEFLEPFFSLLFALLKDVHECESKMQVLYILSFVIERMGSQIAPYSQGLIQYLPLLWHESNDHNMLRCAIVSTLMRLVQALGTWENHNLQRILLPVIELSTDISQPAHVYLLEDGLELWVAVIENATCMTPDLLLLFKNMLPLLDGSSEYLKSCLLIIEAYIIMEPDSVMQNFGDGLIRSFNSMMRDMSNEGITQIMNVIEVFLKAKPGRAVNVIKPALPMVFEAILHGNQLPFLMSSFLSVMARVILIRNDVFLEVMIDYSQSRGLKAEEVFGEFLDSWLKKMEIVTQFDKEKLLALALASMLSSPDREVLHRFCPFLFALKEVMNDIAEFQNEDGLWFDSLMIVGNDLPDDSEEDEELSSKHRKRKRQLALSDPVYTCNLMAYVRDQVNNLRLRLNAEQFNDVMQTVDDETLENIRQFVPL